MDFNENIVDGLIEINKLKEVLGYKDLRSIQSWCKAKNIRLIILGKKNYITRISWDDFFDRILIQNNESKLADQNQVLAGNNSKYKSKGSSFTSANSNVTLNDLVTKYKNKVNG